MIKSKRYIGVYYNILENKDKSYYITYNNGSKKVWEKVGKHSEGIREAFCSQYRADIILRLRLGEDTPKDLRKKNNKTLHQIALMYFEKKDYKGKSYTTFWGRYKNHIHPTLGEKFINDITEDDIDTLKRLKKELSIKTISLIIEMLNSIFVFAIEKGFVKKNPCTKIKIKKSDNARERYLSLDEIELLINHVKDREYLHLFVLLSLSTGARLHDVFCMKKKDFNLIDKTVTIKNRKGNSTYKAFLTKRVLEVLEPKLLELRNPNDILYKKSERTIQRQLQQVLNELFNVGLDNKDSKNRVVIHTLRHTFASQLAIAGTPIFTIQKLLDHKSIEDTLRYAKLSPDNGRDFVEGLF
ncbi:MAG: tyrosine-type recombinase/integrase [Epsilonproteobacteria bacterium]|nr:tyrosine-type recombinase/integrase [Campylobacterota bacterium]